MIDIRDRKANLSVVPVNPNHGFLRHKFYLRHKIKKFVLVHVLCFMFYAHSLRYKV